MSSTINEIQSEVEGIIENNTPDGVVIISRLRGHIENDILNNLAKSNICILAFPPSIGGIKANVVRSVEADDCKLQIHIIENPTMNKTSTDAYELVELILSLNHLKLSNDIRLTLDSVEDASPADEKIVGFIVEFSFRAVFQKQTLTI